MIISYENRYIFIAVPKTGTTSIQKLLLESDPTARNYGIEINGRHYSFGEHDTALQIKSELGDLYSEFRTFGFIRHPYSRIVSSYFFYEQGGKRLDKRNKKRILRELRFLTAKVLPIKIWSVLYPYKSNKEYFIDRDGNVIVDNIGIFENLDKDFLKIADKIGIPISADKIPHSNRSKHEGKDEYFTNKLHEYLIDLKIGNDLEFYNRYIS